MGIVFFILVMVIGIMWRYLERLKASNRELIQINDELIERFKRGNNDDDMTSLLLSIMQDDRDKIMACDNFIEVDDVLKLYERSEIYLPNELVLKMLKFDDRERMFDFMEKQRKAYARMLGNPVYKEKRKTLPK